MSRNSAPPGVDHYPCECGDLRMRFKTTRFGFRRLVYLCHTCDRDVPLIAARLRLSEEWKAQGITPL